MKEIKVKVKFATLTMTLEVEEDAVITFEGVQATVVDLLRDMVQEDDCPQFKWEVVK